MKTFAITRSSVMLEETLHGSVAMEPERPNIHVVRSVWRRLKKGRIVKVFRDLDPIKDVKGGGGPVTDKSGPDTGGKGSTDSR